MKIPKVKRKENHELPNPWHFQQKLRGGRIHESKKHKKEKHKQDLRRKEW